MAEYLSYLGILFAINSILAASLNVINGCCGIFSLGHAGFFAVGAYAGAAVTLFGLPELAAAHPALALLIACAAGMAASSLAGLAVGLPCLRLTGDYLAIVTVGFGEIIRIVLLNMNSVGAARGLPGIAKLTSLPLALAALLLTLWLLNNLMRSSFGRSILAIREDEIAARAMGVNVRFYKTFAFVAGSMFAGLAGCLFAHAQQFLHPSNFNFMVTVQILLMVVVGGLGSQRGALLGAALVTLLPEALRFSAALSQVRMLAFGLVMIVVMLAQPKGLMGLARKRSAA